MSLRSMIPALLLLDGDEWLEVLGRLEGNRKGLKLDF